MLEWLFNSASNNVVRIDGKNQKSWDLLAEPLADGAGELHSFMDNELVALTDASNEKVYPELAQLYRRAVFLIKDDSTPFIVDIFYVKGGETRDYQFHAQSDIEGENFSIAFEDGQVPAAALSVPEYINGHFMRDIKTIASNSAFNACWRIGDDPDCGLLLHMPKGSIKRTVMTSKGQAEGDDSPLPCDAHLTVREEGSELSVFTAVLLPFNNGPVDLSVHQYNFDEVVCIEVMIENNKYMIFHDRVGKTKKTLDTGTHNYSFSGTGCIFKECDERLLSVCISNGTQAQRDEISLDFANEQRGVVTEVDETEKSITVKGMDNIEEGTLIKWINKPWAYRVTSCESSGDKVKLFLDTFSLLDKGRYVMIENGDRIKTLTGYCQDQTSI
jgi:hypothetical protein